ncbi:tetratricopeptide repeat protein [Kitasatospora herbaricolor]|uniref:tetratricopeptide repeat protein n=1 Tax=Kitasatospora herbaricolor TaxID=68217 RepID=UPI0036DD21C2
MGFTQPSPLTEPPGSCPPYVRRVHDDKLAAFVARAQEQQQPVLVCLIADSSTGKTRALWEAVKDLPAPWRVWVPSGSDNLVTVLASRTLAPRTVVWLDDLQVFLGPDGRDARSVAERLHETLQDPFLGPLLLVTTLHCDLCERILSTPPPHTNDPYHTVRRVLKSRTVEPADRKIRLLETFDQGALDETRRLAATDPRLRQALDAEEASGRIPQFLAGSLEQVSRYERASFQTQAVLHAVADAYRLGHRKEIGLDFTKAAAAGYVDRHRWELLPAELREHDAWFTRAIDEMSWSCLGVPGPFAPVVAPPGEVRIGPPVHVMPDYLSQHLRNDRFLQPAPARFWSACEHVTDPESIHALIRSADQRGMFLLGARLRARLGDRDSLAELGQARYQVRDHDGASAAWNAAYGDSDPKLLWHRADLMLRRGRTDGAQAAWRALMLADPDDDHALVFLAHSLVCEGNHLAARDLWAIAEGRGIPYANHKIVEACEQLGDRSGAENAAHADLAAGRQGAADRLVEIMVRKGEWTAAETFAKAALERGAARPMASIARLRREAGDLTGAAAAAAVLADHGYPDLAAGVLAGHTDSGPAPGLPPAALLEGGNDGRGPALRHALRTNLEDRADAADLAGDAATAVPLWWQALAQGSGLASRQLLRLLHITGDSQGVDRLLRETPRQELPLLLTEHSHWLELGKNLHGALVAWRTAEQAGIPADAFSLTRLYHGLGDSSKAKDSADLAARRGDYSAWMWLARALQADGLSDHAQRAWTCASEAGSHTAWLNLAVLRHGQHHEADLRRWGVDEYGRPVGPWSVASLLAEQAP